jgi:hypothetical protein
MIDAIFKKLELKLQIWLFASQILTFLKFDLIYLQSLPTKTNFLYLKSFSCAAHHTRTTISYLKSPKTPQKVQKSLRNVFRLSLPPLGSPFFTVYRRPPLPYLPWK